MSNKMSLPLHVLDDSIFDDHFTNIENFTPINLPKRTSRDTQVNAYGKSLNELCIGNNLISLNGRIKGDLIGQFTCNTYNGASVVDYVIVSQDLFPFVQSFSVHNPTELTHHSCLSVVMRIETPQEVKDIMRLSNHPGYMIWNENKKEKLQNVMLSEEVKHKLDSLIVFSR